MDNKEFSEQAGLSTEPRQTFSYSLWLVIYYSKWYSTFKPSLENKLQSSLPHDSIMLVDQLSSYCFYKLKKILFTHI